MNAKTVSTWILAALCIAGCKKNQPDQNSEADASARTIRTNGIPAFEFARQYAPLDEVYSSDNLGYRQVIGSFTEDKETGVSEVTFSLTSNPGDTNSFRTAYASTSDIKAGRIKLFAPTEQEQLVHIIRRWRQNPGTAKVAVYYITIKKGGMHAEASAPEETTRGNEPTPRTSPETSPEKDVKSDPTGFRANDRNVPPVAAQSDSSPVRVTPPPTLEPKAGKPGASMKAHNKEYADSAPRGDQTARRQTPAPLPHMEPPTQSPPPPSQSPRRLADAVPPKQNPRPPSSASRRETALRYVPEQRPAGYSVKLTDFTKHQGRFWGVYQDKHRTILYADIEPAVKAGVPKLMQINPYTIGVYTSAQGGKPDGVSLVFPRKVRIDKIAVRTATSHELLLGTLFLLEDQKTRATGPPMASLVHPELLAKGTTLYRLAAVTNSPPKISKPFLSPRAASQLPRTFAKR